LVNPDGSPKPAGTKTDTPACRNKRSRRIRAAKREANQKSPYAPELQDMAAAAQGKAVDVAQQVMAEELRPIVREAITHDVLQAISRLVGLNGEAIDVLKAQLTNEDDTIAQRAATLILKYTMGNPSVAPPPSQQAPAPMSVVFNIPRPGDETAALEPAPSDAVELRECGDCNENKPGDEFVGASSRCKDCFAGLHATLDERFAEKDDTKP
jgi:hypothetical protein